MAFESKDSKLRRSRDHFSAAAAQGGGVSGVRGVGVDERCTGLLELQVLRQISKRLTGRTLGEKLALCLCFLLLVSCWELLSSAAFSPPSGGGGGGRLNRP